MQSQRTVARAIDIEGIGLHTGVASRLRILPDDTDRGIVFVRRDLDDAEVPAAVEHLVEGGGLSTTLARGPAVVVTVEHILSALRGLGVDNARIEVDGPEIPIMDGSARPFVEMLRAVGLRVQGKSRRYLTLTKPVSVKQGDKAILALPANDLHATYAIEFPHPAIGSQVVATSLDEEAYVAGIAPARTFCLLKDVEAMRRRGLALGGSLDNALVLSDDGVLNDSLRFSDEFVRHKVLDLIGDLALLGVPLRAHLIAFKAGHRLHAALVKRIVADRAAWSLCSSDEWLPAARLSEYAHLRERVIPAQPATIS